MEQKTSPAEIASRRTLWCVSIGSLFPIVWTLCWAGLANIYGADYLSDPGAKYLDVAFYIHLPAIIFVVPFFVPFTLAAGDDTFLEYQALTVCTIASFFMYGFVGWLFAIIINSIASRTNPTPDSATPTNPNDS
ncbi:MAG: hypothetical protein KDA68_13645 [Planctomycetaceae bacterium]|nr:hypothetical protein [Planctomycetaceae bacterium]